MFIAEPIIAWRKWRVESETFKLLSLFKDTVWTPGERMTAVCTPREGPVHTTRRACEVAPQHDCHCGFWGVHDPSNLPRYGEGTSSRASLAEMKNLIVIGQVSLWGKVWEHELGWRGQYAYPYALTVHPSLNDPWQRDANDHVATQVATALRRAYLVDATVATR